LYVGRWGFQGLDTASSHPREAPEGADGGVEALIGLPEKVCEGLDWWHKEHE
jgi:hypothetical protein